MSKVLNTNPVTYKIKDWNDEEVEGSLYEPELVKYDKQDEQYEKILKTRINKKDWEERVACQMEKL